MVIKVLQGEEQQASKCHEIAEYKININSQEPAGSHKIQVTFNVDENGLLTVTASSVNNQEIREEFKIDKIALSLDPSEIQKLVNIAQQERDEERQREEEQKNEYAENAEGD